MPRPTSKPELIQATTTNYAKLMTLVASFTPEQCRAEFAFEDRDRNLRDVLAHLYVWQEMMRSWYDQGMAGRKPDVPAKGYTWQTTPALNRVIWEDAQQLTLEAASANLEASHRDMLGIIDSHSDEELFTKKFYKWTGTTSLGAYLIGATSSHYDWALKKLRKALKNW